MTELMGTSKECELRGCQAAGWHKDNLEMGNAVASLRAEIERLRAALTELVEINLTYSNAPPQVAALKKALAALGQAAGETK